MSRFANQTVLSPELRTEIWLALAGRLRDGEALYNDHHFRAALLEIYQQVTGQPADDAVGAEIAKMVTCVNRAHPETYLAQGVQNGIARAFEEGVRRNNWDLATIQSRGARALLRFSQQESIRDLLLDANLRPTHLSVADCMQRVIEQVAPRGDVARGQVPPRQPAFRPDLAPPPAPADGPVAVETDADLDTAAEAAVAAGDVDGDTARERAAQGEQRRAQLESREFGKVPQRLDAYVRQGVVTEEEAAKLRQLHKVDERLQVGEIDADQASEIRNSILNAKVRDKLERKVREAVVDSVRYLQVFESMQKIDPKYHDALSFLIQYKNLVVADAGADVDLAPAMHTLMEDVDLLDSLIDVMERKDQELRMMSVRLHPYSTIMSRGIERIGNMTIEESFLDDLAHVDLDHMAERLHSGDAQVRVRPAADMRCMISLVDHLTKRTRFRKEIRLLRIAKQLEEFYRNTSDMKEARHQAESFLNRSLRRLFPDLNADEAADLKQRSGSMMDQIEQRIHDERLAAVEARRVKTEAPVSAGDEGGDGDDMDLSEEDVKSGVQIGRVEVRIAGKRRRIPTKIMPDPDDAAQMIIVTRDRETQVLVPAMRRGDKRRVERTREGYWVETR